jgi:hypothetical protein
VARIGIGVAPHPCGVGARGVFGANIGCGISAYRKCGGASKEKRRRSEGISGKRRRQQRYLSRGAYGGVAAAAKTEKTQAALRGGMASESVSKRHLAAKESIIMGSMKAATIVNNQRNSKHQ